MEIDFMVESDSYYDSNHVPVILKIGVSVLDALLH